jgi:hypothetical protein
MGCYVALCGVVIRVQISSTLVRVCVWPLPGCACVCVCVFVCARVCVCGAESRKQRAGSREQRSESREQGAGSREQRAEGREQRAEIREQRAERPHTECISSALLHENQGGLCGHHNTT